MEDSGARIIIACACGQRMKVPVEAQGKRYRCVKCGAPLTVGGSSDTASGTQPGDAPGSLGAQPAPPKRERIGQLLIKEGLINKEQLEEALAIQRTRGGKTFEILVELGHLDKQALHDFLSRQPGVAAINLANYKLEQDLVDLIPKELALREKVIPIDRLGKLLTVAMACPLDVDTIDEIQRVTGLKVKAMLCLLDDIEPAVEHFYRKSRSSGADAQLFERILADVPEVPPQVKTQAQAPPPAPPAPVGSAPAAATAATPPATPPRELTAAAAQRFIALAEDPNTSTRELARVAEADAALANVLIRAVNSGLYGLTEKTESAAIAVVIMGKEGVAELLRTAFG